MDEENMLQLYQNRYDETDPSSAEAREACFSPQEMRGPADINRVVVPIVDQQDARRSHATNGARCGARTHDPEIKSLVLCADGKSED